jgi:hypothetical protein
LWLALIYIYLATSFKTRSSWSAKVRKLNGFIYSKCAHQPTYFSLQIFFLVLVLWHFSSLKNSCYMNATIQALRAIPELQAALDASAPPPTDIASALRDLFTEMDRVKLNKGTVTPTNLLRQLRAAVPHFGTMDNTGTHYAQQGQSCFFCCLESKSFGSFAS